jgi:hypothetical protein
MLQDRGTYLIAILVDLPEIAPLRFRQRRHSPVVDHQNVDASQPCQQIAQAPSARAIARSRNSDWARVYSAE